MTDFLPILRYWQKALSLQDWEVVFRVNDSRDFADDKDGHISAQWEKKRALLEIRDPALPPRDFERNFFVSEAFDAEVAIVHELLHLHLQGLSRCAQDSLEEVASSFEEQACQKIAEALVMERYKKEEPD